MLTSYHSPSHFFVEEFRSGKASDIISTLVSIYDTRDVIVKELQILLAQKLLAVKDYDLEKEVSRSIPFSRLIRLCQKETDSDSGCDASHPPDPNRRDPQASIRRGRASGLRGHAQGSG